MIDRKARATVRAFRVLTPHDFPSSAMSLRFTLIALALCLLPLDTLAQTGEDILRFGQREPGASTRMAGLAGAGVGGVADWGAIVVNPAGLALIGGTHTTFSLDAFSVLSETATGDQLDARVNQVGVGHAAYVGRVPAVRGAFVYGLGYNRTASLDRRLFATSGAGQRADFYESGYVGEFTGAAAWEIAPRVYLGGSANLVFGQYVFLEQRAASDRFETSVRGFNARGGLVADVAEGVRLGISAETPTWLYAEDFVGVSAFADDYTMQTPWRLAVGGAYQRDGILIAADIEYADWSQARLRPTTVFGPENIDLQTLYRETIDVRLGAEYDFGIGALRGGYALRQDPLRDEVETNRIRHTIGTGFSYYAARGITLDLAVSYTEFDDQVFAFDGPPVLETVGSLRGVFGIQINL